MRQALLRLGAAGRQAEARAGTASSPAPRQGRQDNSNLASRARTPAGRRRFVQDGEVVVEYAPSRAAAADQAGLDLANEDADRRFAAERKGREDAEAALAEARATLDTMRVRLAHLEIALRESQDQCEQVRQEALDREAALRESLRVEREGAELARQETLRVEALRRELERDKRESSAELKAARAVRSAAPDAEDAPQPALFELDKSEPVRKRRGAARVADAAAAEPEPVRWWK